MARWDEFDTEQPELAAFGSARLARPPAYLATIMKTGIPRVHPVTPIIAAGALFIFMHPMSPKGRDLRERSWYALHNAVPDIVGSGGEFFINGRGSLVKDPQSRVAAAVAAVYEPADHYILFELTSEKRAAMGMAMLLCLVAGGGWIGQRDSPARKAGPPTLMSPTRVTAPEGSPPTMDPKSEHAAEETTGSAPGSDHRHRPSPCRFGEPDDPPWSPLSEVRNGACDRRRRRDGRTGAIR